jgi:hypothetical protein
MARKGKSRKAKPKPRKTRVRKASKSTKRKAKPRSKSKSVVKRARRTAAKSRKIKQVTSKPLAKMKPKEDICCKNIDLAKWNFRRVKWRNKPFYVVKYGTFFHIPIGMDKVMTNGMELLRTKYKTDYPEFWLAKDTGLFSAKMFFAVNRVNPRDPNVIMLSGTYVTRGFQGPYKNMGNYIRVFMEQVHQKYGLKPKDLLFWYVNCPKCAKKQGGPKIVIFGKISK